MKEITDLGKHYLEECRKKLHFKDLKIPKLTAEQIEYNIEMIASEDEDYITLFQGGLITKNELIDLLVGKITGVQMNKLKEGKLLKKLKKWRNLIVKSSISYNWDLTDEQAHEQIVALINNCVA